MLSKLCPPALIYLVFSTTQIIIDTIKGFYNTAFLKLWVTLAFSILLNYLCARGLSIISWIIVFIPFILMTLIISILLVMFGLNPSTGRTKIYESKHSIPGMKKGKKKGKFPQAEPMEKPITLPKDDIQDAYQKKNCKTFCKEFCTPTCKKWKCPICKKTKDSGKKKPKHFGKKKCKLYCPLGSRCTDKCRYWKCPNCIPPAPYDLKTKCATSSKKCKQMCTKQVSNLCLHKKKFLRPKRECIPWAPCLILKKKREPIPEGFKHGLL